MVFRGVLLQKMTNTRTVWHVWCHSGMSSLTSIGQGHLRNEQRPILSHHSILVVWQRVPILKYINFDYLFGDSLGVITSYPEQGAASCCWSNFEATFNIRMTFLAFNLQNVHILHRFTRTKMVNQNNKKPLLAWMDARMDANSQQFRQLPFGELLCHRDHVIRVISVRWGKRPEIGNAWLSTLFSIYF